MSDLKQQLRDSIALEERLSRARAKLAASTKGPNGPPLPGYAERVAAIRAEIARLEAQDA